MAERVEYLDDKGRYLPRMYDELVAELAAKYDLKNWIERCRAKELHPDLQVAFEEEAARLEFDMDVPKEAAEVRAAEIVFAKFNILLPSCSKPCAEALRPVPTKSPYAI